MWGAISRRVLLGKPGFVRCATNYTGGISNVRPPPVPDVARKPRRLPFLKSIYADQYDVDVLTYPETLNLERHKDLERRVRLVHDGCSRVDAARQLGLFAMNAPYPSSGLNMSDTEIARMFEHLDRDTFKTVFGHTLAVGVIKTFGTPGQKSKYLPPLASGAVCSWHDDGTARAAPLPDGSWELTACAAVDAAAAYLLFVVEDKAFVVEKHRAVASGENVRLDRLVVPPDDVFDNVDATKITDTGKLYACSVLASSLKKVLRATVMGVLPKSRLNLKLREFDSVLKIVARALINIYTIESMVYLTTWMTDGFDDPDVELESAAVQLFARQTVGTTLAELKMLNGRSSIEPPFCTLCDDVEDLVESLEGSMKLANFISVRGIDYLKKSDYKENVSFITSMYRNIMMKNYEPSLKYDLKQFLHPALMYSANFLEHCVLKFQFAIDQSHSANQLDAGNQQLMERFSTVIVHIYAMTAVIGRASRSYCTGIRFCDHEMQIGETRIRESSALLKPILEELINGKYVAVDSLYESFARQGLDNIKNVQTKA